MSYAEKPEDVTREEWIDKLNNVHIQRADMNRLIMNYLVTGEVLLDTHCLFSYVREDQMCRYLCFFFLLWLGQEFIVFFVQQRVSRRQRRSSGWSLE